MPTSTVTEVLAELKTINNRLAKKMAFVKQAACIPASFKDPLEAQGGTKAAVASEMQAISDLLWRKVILRQAIARSNNNTLITIGDRTLPVAEWLIWRREVSTDEAAFYTSLNQTIQSKRAETARNSRAQLAAVGAPPEDLTVFVDELGLKRSSETLETILGKLDGQLSLKNATTILEI